MGTEVAAYSQLTLLETAKRVDPSGKAAKIAEILVKKNKILGDMPWRAANAPTANKTTRRAYDPVGSWRSFNAGVAAEASQTVEVWDVMGMLETYSEVDVDLAKLHSDGPKAARQEEAVSFLNGLSKTFATTLIYGDIRTDPEKFMGFFPRMDALAATTNVIGCGGTGSDTTSILVVQWGDECYMIYPPGDPQGGQQLIKHRPLGEVTKVDSNSLMWQVYCDHFQVKAGLVVKNPKCIGRIANIESSGTTNLFDEDHLIKLLNRMPEGKKWIYCNDTIISQMQIMMKDKANVNFTPGKGEGLAGEPVMYFGGNPIRQVDAITNAETAIA